MTIEKLRGFFGWCALINMALLTFWILWLLVAHDFVYHVHGKWLNISVEQFDAIHYTGMLYFKMAIFLLNIVPYFALRIIEKDSST
ncbi:DUF6868 family protein [Amphritea sp. HPY]|uniref:DUF6868 family protein n=1 Tax=Amphritea sp. HPY TaxID=3421652 RepID=UPI003D7CF599